MGGGTSKPKEKKRERGFCTEEWDETYQCFFYHYSTSGESSWERPEGIPESEDAKSLKARNAKAAAAISAATAAKVAAAGAAAERATALRKESSQDTASVCSDVSDVIPVTTAEEASHWTVGWDENYETAFYYNSATGENVWEKPACLVALEAQEARINLDARSEGYKTAISDPANWTAEWDISYCCHFYFNKITGESTWDIPVCMKHALSTASGAGDLKQGDTGRRRKNSIMRRPSVRPEKATLRRVSVLQTSSTAERTTSPGAASSSANSKRRQSLCPRPSSLPPRPLFVTDELRDSFLEQ